MSGERRLTVLMKNWEPPEFGSPVLAIESVPGSLDFFSVCSSGMFPPASRFTWRAWGGGEGADARRREQ